MLDEGGGPSTMVVFKLRPPLSANVADVTWCNISVGLHHFHFCLSHIRYPALHEILLACLALDHIDIFQNVVLFCLECLWLYPSL